MEGDSREAVGFPQILGVSLRGVPLSVKGDLKKRNKGRPHGWAPLLFTLRSCSQREGVGLASVNTILCLFRMTVSTYFAPGFSGTISSMLEVS